MDEAMTTRVLFFSLVLSLTRAEATPPKPPLEAHLQPALFAVTMVMIHDVASPPAASRFYTYCLLGAHDLVAQHQKTIVPPSRLIREFTDNPVSIKAGCNYQIAALYCILETGRLLMPSGEVLAEDQQKLLANLQKEGYSQASIDESVRVAREETKRILAYAATDKYRLLSARTRYRPTKGDGNWYPTPPGYIEAVEPHWRTIRPMMLDSASQFKPAAARRV